MSTNPHPTHEEASPNDAFLIGAITGIMGSTLALYIGITLTLGAQFTLELIAHNLTASLAFIGTISIISGLLSMVNLRRLNKNNHTEKK